jgi:predicted heme/steroid binding protein
VTQAFGEDEAALAGDILRSFANADPTQLPLDLPALLERFQIDALSGDALVGWEKRMIEQATQAPPPAAPATPNGAAGTTDTGFYYNAPELIQLAEDETLLASLPKTKHYSDRAVLAQTRLVRKLWRALLTEQYEDFAQHIAKADLSLADDQEQSAAERIVAGWRFTGAVAAKTIKTVALALGKILARAGSLELSASRIKTDAWDPEDKDLSAWTRDNAAALVRSVDETTRKQLSTFLAAELRAGHGADEIATNLRAHFAGFADWRADLIATTETARYYNAGTLFAGAAAGVKQVQALDNQGSGQSDPACVARHGRIYDVSAAWQESDHPRGTLSWRLLPAGVQLTFATHPRNEDAVAARIDQQERVIHLVEGMDAAVEGGFLERAVDWFIASF